MRHRRQLFSTLYQADSKWSKVLYIHTPFCLQQCRYCVFPSRSDFTSEDFSFFYEKIIPEQIESYRPIFDAEEFDEVYFGGGTPTIASADIIREMYQRIPGFRRISIKSTEASPKTLTEDHIRLFEGYEFSFLSIGVQSLSENILRKQNRLIVSLKRLEEISRRLRDTNLIWNVDLICYLDHGDTRDIPGFRRDLERTMDVLFPDSITIHSEVNQPHTYEKSKRLISTIQEALVTRPKYRCVNAILDDEEVEHSTRYGAEYRLMRRGFDFFHYMWAKNVSIPVYGYSVLSLGYTDEVQTWSNAGFYTVSSYDFGLTGHVGKVKEWARNHRVIRRSLNLPFHQVDRDENSVLYPSLGEVDSPDNIRIFPEKKHG